jgi:Leucine-rich repeat (LRR) protein
LPTVKSGLFKAELNKIEYLFLVSNQIEVIEPKAFEHLNKLKWIALRANKIQTLSYRLFKNHPDLKYISLEHNQINAIHPNFFDGLSKLKQIDLAWNVCVRTNIGCKNCTITQEELKSGLQECFDNCKNVYRSKLACKKTET